MKKLLLMLVAMLAFVGVYSQTMTLSFVGHGKGGNVEDEIYQQIDSLLVRNITRDWDRMIYYPDTVIIMNVLDVPLIDVKREGVEQNVPNPFDCVTDVELNLSHDDAVSISIVDVNGREYLHYSGNLSAGSHVFEVTLSKPQAYMLTAVTGDSKYTIKMVNLGSCGKDEIALKSSSTIGVRTKSLIGEHFEYGDAMEYYAYTTYNGLVFNASEFREQNSSENIVIHFRIPYCERTFNVDYERGCESFTWIDGVTYYETNHNAARADLKSAGGCDSIVLLDITIEHPVQTEESITACHAIVWNGQQCSATGTYTAHLHTLGGCDSTVNLHFSRQNNITNDVYQQGCGGYIWNGEVYDETGTYQQTFITNYGCDSIVTLHYTNLSDYTVENVTACDSYTWHGRLYYADNNTDTIHLRNIYGCDSIVRLNLTVAHSQSSNLNVTACRQYYYNGQLYTQGGVYPQHLTSVAGCDSLVTLRLTITESVETDIYETGCDSFTFDNGQTYTQSDDYDIHYTTPVGCDSIIHLHLEIYHGSSSSMNVVACDSYSWRGNVYTESGTYYETLHTTHGCDSVVTLYLTINHSSSKEITINACHSYDLNGETITVSNDYIRTYTAANGCDSVVTYHINIYDDVVTEFTKYACGSFTWDGDTYTQSNDYVKHYNSFVGCDSTVTMHLIIGEPNYDIEDVQTSCDSYEWEGDVYTTSGTHTKTLENRYGCDSVVTLQLTINTSYYDIEDVQVACDSYTWAGETYYTSGIHTKNLHTVLGCDSIVTLNLTVNNSVEHEFYDTTCGEYDWDGRTYSASGDFPFTYTAVNGCDSVVTLHLVYHELVVDARDGNTYCTMEYGDQVWMTENMRYLPQVDNTSSIMDNSVPKYYVYGYTQTYLPTALGMPNYNTYGVLYNYAAALEACPSGWHLPSKQEWDNFVNYLKSNEEFVCGTNVTNVAKSIASNDLWQTSNTECAVGNVLEDNNASAFNGKPGGYVDTFYNTTLSNETFKNLNSEADWWTSTQVNTSVAIRFNISKDSKTTSNSEKNKSFGYSVRCIKNTEEGNK